MQSTPPAAFYFNVDIGKWLYDGGRKGKVMCLHRPKMAV